MDKKSLLSHAEYIIENATYTDIEGTHRIKFERNGVRCDMRIHGDKWFWTWFEGYVRIRELNDFATVAKHDLDEEEYNKLRDMVLTRIQKLKDDKLHKVFPDARRNENINDILQ